MSLGEREPASRSPAWKEYGRLLLPRATASCRAGGWVTPGCSPDSKDPLILHNEKPLDLFTHGVSSLDF